MMSTSAPDRLTHLDALRGFALMGIALVNYQVFASAYYGSGFPQPGFDTVWDRATLLALAVFFEAKFYLLFSFLFGYSFYLQMQAAERAGAAFGARMGRRLAGLAALGLAHGLLFFQGDILLAYALFGLVLLACRHWSPRRALRVALALIVLGMLPWLLLALLSNPDEADPLSWQEAYAHIQAQIAAYRGPVGEVIAQHWHDLSREVWLAELFGQGPGAMAMFLVGLALAKRQALHAPWTHRAALRALAWLALPLGLAGAVFYGVVSAPGATWQMTLMALAIGMLTAPLLSLAYVCLFMLAWGRRWGARVLGWLAPAGRMALSNYLLQSVAGAWLFTGWGLGLIDRVGPPVALGLALLVFAAELAASAWWMRRHAYGPVEWGLRCLTQGRRVPWRRQTAAVS
ncbi:DUF418 domain-containing protein [Bordetella trematum]|uniref:DUF418 domain-containing protein n=1 Tax=Bordetella trematum TaxID=123899 RepID=UPI003989860E